MVGRPMPWVPRRSNADAMRGAPTGFQAQRGVFPCLRARGHTVRRTSSRCRRASPRSITASLNFAIAPDMVRVLTVLS